MGNCRTLIMGIIALSGACAPPAPPVTPQSAPAEKPGPIEPTPPAVDQTKAPEPAPAPSPKPEATSTAAMLHHLDARACPADMKLIDGDYCTEVEHTCSKEWYASWNKKRVCEVFEPKATCKGERIPKRYCMDTYAWPNVKGERPEVMNTFYQAQVKCAAIGKRLCTESEWDLACEGPEMKPFPYGFTRDANICNGDHPWDGPDMAKVAKRDPDELARLWKGVRNGDQPGCVSDYGVWDMPGNTDDIVATESPKATYDSATTGGPWYSGVRNQCRPKIYSHDEGFYYYFLSFRCCADADGKASDPRTPRQQKEGWSFSKVEQRAGFTVAEAKAKLDEKTATGACACKDKDVRCKTLCGTLLGPGAKDVKLPWKPANSSP